MALRFNYLLFSFTLLCFHLSMGQKNLHGRVITEYLEMLPGAKIFDSDTTLLGTSDWNGYFKINLPEDSETLIIADIGMEWAKISISKGCENLEIILLMDGTYDFMSSNKIDRLRKKRFDRIPELHSKAFQNGLFKTESPCFGREFEPDKPVLDRISRELKEFRKLNKNGFKGLKKGDIVKIPFGLDKSKKRINTYYSPCKNCKEEDYDYVIIGEIINKHRKKLTLDIKITKMQPYESLEYEGKILNIGSDFKYEMKYFEVIINSDTYLIVQ